VRIIQKNHKEKYGEFVAYKLKTLKNEGEKTESSRLINLQFALNIEAFLEALL
jgi:hypothetical protein